MNAEHVACASSAAVEHWDQIDWKRCEQQVARLQARIVKASREGRWGKVKALQRLLTCSFSGKALAVKRVTENKGKRTSGVDQILWSTPQSKLKAIASLQRRGYRPLPLRRVYIPKSNGKLHLGSKEAGPKIAAIFSIVESCRRLDIPIRKYLGDVLPGLANRSIQSLAELTPTAYAARMAN